MSNEAKAAQILADFFSSTVCGALSQNPPRTVLYGWEQDALDWLREWRKRDEQTPICLWTASYMEFGPPPWHGALPSRTRALLSQREAKP